MKKAVEYLRYSSDNQTEQSIEGQMRVCHEYAKRNDNREQFQKMLKDSDKKSFNYVLVFTQSICCCICSLNCSSNYVTHVLPDRVAFEHAALFFLNLVWIKVLSLCCKLNRFLFNEKIHRI